MLTFEILNALNLGKVIARLKKTLIKFQTREQKYDSSARKKNVSLAVDVQKLLKLKLHLFVIYLSSCSNLVSK